MSARPVLRASLIAACLLFALAALPAAAYQARYASAGTVCQPANGGLAKFTFSAQYLTNTGTTDQTVVCSLVQDDAGFEALPMYLSLWMLVPQAGKSVTCMAQVGSFGNSG